MAYDLDAVRAAFPALALTDDGVRRIYFDNPAGTQVPQSVADAMSECLLTKSANTGGVFATSQAAEAVCLGAHEAMADFLNAPASDEIIFGPNMTTLTFSLSRSLGNLFEPGDEIIVTRMDHDSNVWPWVMLARDRGFDIRWLDVNTETYEFDLDDLDDLLTDKTRLVCIGGASNMIGTLNDVATVCARASAAGALSFVDAVQSAPHVATDIQALGCDFFACSPYKFFGPHQGVLWGRRELLESLEPYQVRPPLGKLPYRFETGTPSHEGMAGTQAAVDYFAWIGESMAEEDRWPQFDGRRKHVHNAMDLLFEYETTLVDRLIQGLQSFDGVKVHGITAADALERRVPTVGFTADGHHPDDIAQALADRNIFVWSGHNYALELVQRLGLYESGGVVRVGPVHYNSMAEIDEFLGALGDILGS